MEETEKNDVSKDNEEPVVTTPEDIQSQEDLSVETSDSSDEKMEDMMALYEESFKRFAEGEVVVGRIISIDKDYVLVDIGYKSEGQIRINEFKDEDGNLDANIEDEVEVMVEVWEIGRASCRERV